MIRKVKTNYDSLEKIQNFLETKDPGFKYGIKFDQWEGIEFSQLANRTINNNCLVIEKTAFVGAKIKFVEANAIDIQPIAPGTFANNLTQKGILAIVISLFIKSSQNKVADSIEQLILEIQN